MREFLYYVSIVVLFLGTITLVLLIPEFILDTEPSNFWKGLASAAAFIVIPIVKPHLKRILLGDKAKDTEK